MFEQSEVPEEVAVGSKAGGPTRVQSVERAAQVLMAIAAMPEQERTVKNLVRELGTTVPTMYHLLNTLVDAKLLTRDHRRQYHLGVGIGYLATAYYQQRQPSPELVSPLRALTAATGDTAYLSGWRGGELEVLAQETGTRAVRVVDLGPGFHGLAHARASGKALLAFATPEERERYLARYPLTGLTHKTITDRATLDAELKLVAERGYATEEEEFCEGVACLSVPIIDGKFLLGAYTISAPVERYRMQYHVYLSGLREAAKAAIANAAAGHGAGPDDAVESEAIA